MVLDGVSCWSSFIADERLESLPSLKSTVADTLYLSLSYVSCVLVLFLDTGPVI